MTNKKTLTQDDGEQITPEKTSEEIKDTNKQVEELQQKIEQLEKEKDSYLKGWQQERADVLNYKQKENERISGAVKFANQALLKDLISVVDNFDFTVANLESLKQVDGEKSKNWEVMLKGIYLVKSNLEKLLTDYGLTKITALGQTFNPALHEAVNYISDTTQPADIITEELQSGYSLEGRTIRPAKVVVNSPPEVKQSTQMENKSDE
ncbi:MAG TPA: nucleotide exchange factor GrpE [Candidatus Paceibacterota bacterium]|nr:nucleotide exchange factor GrpE [Candidatus Paceibacterota bacterium]